VLNWRDANSTEFDPETPHAVVVFMPEIDSERMFFKAIHDLFYDVKNVYIYFLM